MLLYSSLGVGLIAGLHGNRELSLISFAGSLFKPGRKHRISVSKRAHYRLGDAYQECQTSVPYMLQVAYDHFGSADYDYNEYSCYIVCTQSYM